MNTCGWCGCEFSPDIWHPHAVYCTGAHRDLAWNKKRRDARNFTPSVQTAADAAPADDVVLITELQKRGFYVLKPDDKAQETRYNDLDFSIFDGNVYKLAVVGDTHYCSKQQQRTHLHHFYQYAHEYEGVNDFLHLGDLSNGSGKQHVGQEYENFVHGEDDQLDYIEADYPKIPGCNTKVIGGSHDYSFFKLSGSDILKRLAERRDDIEYLGYAGAYVNLTPEVDIYLCHPDGGTAYALSYHAQRKVENFTPENKPNICLFGHYHRMLHFMDRNVEVLLNGCFQSQTPFLKAKNIAPVIGGWIVEVTTSENGLARFRSEFMRYYVPVENDF